CAPIYYGNYGFAYW
nr:immunoglobulin heavy chain junction region [Mus musculus]